MGRSFQALDRKEQAIVAAYARAEWERVVSLKPPTYISANAAADPKAWQERLCEFLASDPKQMHAINTVEQGNASGGFTLIEMSIVLVVIGLIVGGILVGRDLISAAAVRAQISQIEQYNTAANTFRGKYGYLPGDIRDPDASNFGFAPRGQYAGEGDGNGLVEGVSSDAPNANNGTWEIEGETLMFWADLSAAHLIEGSFAITGPTTSLFPPNAMGSAYYFPPAKVADGSYVYVYSVNGVNYFCVSESSPKAMAFTVQQAYLIDQKIDDGKASTGNVSAQGLAVWMTVSPNTVHLTILIRWEQSLRRVHCGLRGRSE